MEPLHLFRQFVATSGENAFTEALAATLRRSSCFRRAFLAKFGLFDDMVQIETQPTHYSTAGRPDLQMSSPQYLVLCEGKVDAPLSLEQWHRYEEILTRASGARKKYLLAIVKDRRGVDAGIRDSAPEGQVWLWAEVFEMATQVAPEESDPVASFLLSELTDLLKESCMRPFTQLTQEDFSVVHGLRGVRERMEAFFKEVLFKLGRILTKGRFSWETYRDVLEMYPGITFDLITQGASWKGWIGFELGAGTEPHGLLSLWEGEGGPRPGDARASRLMAHGLEWDNGEWCWCKPLALRLSSGKAGLELVDDVTKEVGAIVNDIISGLSGARPERRGA